ncbi:uncharacterized protein [Aegilops tauschii subsp. strangulata]|uniref:uncharacterized protein n=1 Tax=Aegilops tauschii subsp. strangulata TaxID=200361 RepID=UPI000989BAF5|nr:uncharacterized protein LOC109778683 [Aegilops tauschii subsp. strangulata]
MESPGSSFSTRTNPFASPEPVLIHDLNILGRDHIDGSMDYRFMVNDDEWMTIDATLIRWFYTTISKDLFHMVVSAEDDALAVWTKLNGLFIDNKHQRKVFLHGEFFGCQQHDSSIDDYCMRLKKHVDELCDLGEKVSDELLLSTLHAGLDDDFGNTASNLPLITDPTFPKVMAYLKLEERWMKTARTRTTHTALTVGTGGGAPPAAPAPQPRPGPGLY